MQRVCFLSVAVLAACSSSSATHVDAAPAAPMVDASRYGADLASITGDRTHGNAHWMETQDRCAQRFAELGYTVERYEYATGVDIVGVLPGTTLPDERVYVSAHYDSVTSCAGADDNATGIAGVLEAARLLAQTPHARTVVVGCWDEEERGLLGSKAYVSRSRSTNEKIVGSFVFEMIGYKSEQPGSQMTDDQIELVYPEQSAEVAAHDNKGDFLLVIHDSMSADAAAALNTTADLVSLRTITFPVDDSLKKSSLAAALRRSDHASFWDFDYPAVQVTDTANYRNPHYHCTGGPDELVDVDVEFAAQITASVVGGALHLLDR